MMTWSTVPSEVQTHDAALLLALVRFSVLLPVGYSFESTRSYV